MDEGDELIVLRVVTVDMNGKLQMKLIVYTLSLINIYR